MTRVDAVKAAKKLKLSERMRELLLVIAKGPTNSLGWMRFRANGTVVALYRRSLITVWFSYGYANETKLTTTGRELADGLAGEGEA